MAPVPYRLRDVDQFDPADRPPASPDPTDTGRRWLLALAADAAVYGMPAVLQYGEMYVQAVATGHPRSTGFGVFDHQREPAGPDFRAFRVPTVDNLYSNAFIDLSVGPAIVSIPPMGERYYTLSFLDAHSNASNLSARTIGPDGGDFLVLPPSQWDAPAPDEAVSARPFRVASPYMWILMRVSRALGEPDWSHVHELQDRVVIRQLGASRDPAEFPFADPDSVRADAATFFRALDFVLRHNGQPIEEEALVHRYRALGLGGPSPLQFDALDDHVKLALVDGLASAFETIAATRRRTGTLGASGWTSSDPGGYGYDHLGRAVTNFLGLGANPAVENKPFVTFVDAAGERLDGTAGSYRWHTPVRPPGHDIWSLTLYEVATGQVYDNPLGRHKVGTGVPGTGQAHDGSWTVTVSHEPPDDTTNWLPAPAGPFFLAIRVWRPASAVLDGSWEPESVQRVEPR